MLFLQRGASHAPASRIAIRPAKSRRNPSAGEIMRRMQAHGCAPTTNSRQPKPGYYGKHGRIYMGISVEYVTHENLALREQVPDSRPHF